MPHTTNTAPADARLASWAGPNGRTAAGIALGLAGLFMFNLICGPFAIALGISAWRRTGRTNPTGRASAALSVLLGVADLVVLVALMATKVRHGGLDWQLG